MAAEPQPPRSRPGRVRHLLDQYPAVTRQSILVGAVASVALLLLVHVDGMFLPGRTVWIEVNAVALAVLAGRSVVLKRTNEFEVWVWCASGIVSVAVVGSSALSLGVVMCCGLACASVLVTAATVLRGWQVLLVVLMTGIALSAILTQSGVVGAAVPVICLAATVLACSPSLVVWHYRADLERAVTRANRLALIDELTGVLNRHGLAERAEELVARATREGRYVGVLIADIDHFKQVNDRFGHLVGDDVLRQVAQALSRSVRTGDLLARMGGEEFCAVVVLNDPGELRGMGERLRQGVVAGELDRPVTISVGGAFARPQPAGTAADLVYTLASTADVLMYEAKQAGRNAVRVPAA